VLKSHIIDGKPVVPFALMTEWFGHGALHANPGLFLHGIDDMHLLKGIRLEKGAKTVRLMAGKTTRAKMLFTVDLEIRDGMQDGMPVIHSRARGPVERKCPESPDAFDWAACPVDRAKDRYEGSVAQVYDDILFHGETLKGIESIHASSDRGMIADLKAAAAPETWMVEPLRTQWISDPLILDAAFQMVSVWSYLNCGNVSLPSSAVSYRQYCRAFPEEGVTAVFVAREVTHRKVKGDFAFLDANDRVVGEMKGYVALMDASLYNAFKPGRASEQTSP
jgi:hypothetical protein